MSRYVLPAVALVASLAGREAAPMDPITYTVKANRLDDPKNAPDLRPRRVRRAEARAAAKAARRAALAATEAR